MDKFAVLAKPLTSPPLLQLFGSFRRSPCPLLLFLFGSASMEVFDHDTDKHVKHEESDEEQERNEVDQTPLVEVFPRLKRQS